MLGWSSGFFSKFYSEEPAMLKFLHYQHTQQKLLMAKMPQISSFGIIIDLINKMSCCHKLPSNNKIKGFRETRAKWVVCWLLTFFSLSLRSENLTWSNKRCHEKSPNEENGKTFDLTLPNLTTPSRAMFSLTVAGFQDHANALFIMFWTFRTFLIGTFLVRTFLVGPASSTSHYSL